jgi:hypothetical protein
MKLLLLSIIGVFILTSCSTGRIVNSRAYKTTNKIQKGDSKRHVSNPESQKSKHKQYILAPSKNTPEQEVLESSVSSSLDKSYSSTSTFAEDNTVTKDKLNKSKKDETIKLSTIQSSIEKNKKPISSEPNDKDARVFDPISIISSIFASLGALSIFLSVLYVNAGLAFPALLFIGFAFLITAFILGLIAIQRKKRNRKKYKGVALAIIGFSAGLAGTILFLLVIAAIMISFF